MSTPSPSSAAAPSLLPYYALLLLSVTMCSSAGPVFALLSSVPPFLKAGYRLTFQSLFQLVPWLFSNSAPPNSYPSCVPYLLLAGFMLGTHFCTWVYSIDHTTLSHSLLFVSMHPIILNFYYHVRSRLWGERRPSSLETIGSVVGVAGAAVMMADVGSEESGTQSPTLWGDFVAFLGAVAMSIYLLIGERFRGEKGGWDLWTYIEPVTVIATLTCWVYSFLLEERSVKMFCLDEDCVFGCFKGDRLWYSIYLGVAAGIGGHAGLNFLLKFLSTQIIGTALLAEPVVGSIIGYALDVQEKRGKELKVPVVF
ncbi:hypothetical protein TrLO_g8262 [Triparma laevis f. longispina]|uniref:EamA domain-containing protein n=1 Tax=Triparma laevis f. longispina TaxID=1714387 RepID=A0A9W7CKU5_9STRA|nr:hypothetical protein TrLO_g8262 [Triparma laevis f. longispina]